MSIHSKSLMAFLALALSGCSTLGGNISGDWSCKAVKGGACRTTHEIDVEVLEDETPALEAMPVLMEPLGLASVLSDSHDDVLAVADGSPPRRSADTVARIVFLPFVDDQGVFHSRAVAYAIMTRGVWLASPKE